MSARGRVDSQIMSIPIVMNYRYHPLLRPRDMNPLGLETYATPSRWTKATAFFNNERSQILNRRPSSNAYQRRREFRVESEATFEDVDGCFGARYGIPKNEHPTRFHGGFRAYQSSATLTPPITTYVGRIILINESRTTMKAHRASLPRDDVSF
jgi:hypothetical protein